MCQWKASLINGSWRDSSKLNRQEKGIILLKIEIQAKSALITFARLIQVVLKKKFLLIAVLDEGLRIL